MKRKLETTHVIDESLLQPLGKYMFKSIRTCIPIFILSQTTFSSLLSSISSLLGYSLHPYTPLGINTITT